MTLLLAPERALLSGCSTVQPKCTSAEDSPTHHYMMGMKALEDGNITIAQEKFERALYCDDGFSIAHAGMAIVFAEKVKAQTDAGFRGVESERVAEELKKARKFADRPGQYFDYYAAVIRSDTLMKQKKWLGDCRRRLQTTAANSQWTSATWPITREPKRYPSSWASPGWKARNSRRPATPSVPY